MMIRFAVLLLIAIGLTVPARAGLSGVSACPSRTSAWSCPVDLDKTRSLVQTASELPCPGKAIVPGTSPCGSPASAVLRLHHAPQGALVSAIVTGIDRPPKPSTV